MLADFWESYVERKKIQIVLGIVALFFVSMAMSCQEMRYMISGKTVDAKLEQSRLEKVGGTEEAPELKRVLTYSFQDKDTFRREYADVSVNWSNGNSDVLKVQYLPGKDRYSRMVGDRKMGWVAIFVGSLVLLAGGAVWIALEK